MEIPAATAASAPTPTERPMPESEPAEYAIDYEEWKAGRRPYEYLSLAGFEFTLRQGGRLLAKQLRAQWDTEFERYRKS